MHGAPITLCMRASPLPCTLPAHTHARMHARMQELTAACAAPSPALVSQAGQCHRCRSELGVVGQLCEHCKLDELLVGVRGCWGG